MADIVSTYYHSPVGCLKISATNEYVCQVSFRDEIPAGEKRHALSPLLIQCTEQLIEYFNGQRRVFELPLHQPGSSFQQAVWGSLLTIPFGRTVSYMQQAIRLGDPKSIRAVATANGRNDIAIIVPCHRVIGSNRSLVGYAGGLWRKKWLLEHEMKHAWGVRELFS